MAQSQSTSTSQSADRDVLTILEGRSCTRCDDGELERTTYKENDAVVCDDCEVPHAQVWETSPAVQ